MIEIPLHLKIFIFTSIILAACGESVIFVWTKSSACSKNEFECYVSETCIPKSYVCNGFADCKDKEDEKNCDIKKCEDTEKFFKCRDGEQCISRKLICDNEGDCNDNSDESDELCHHVPPTPISRASEREEINECNKTSQFECASGICIPIEDRCDGTKHCRNGKDEKDCDTIKVKCAGFLCDNGICLASHEFMCDGLEDCTDGSDEKNCSPTCEKSDNKFLCKDGECIDLPKVCDGKNDCSDGSDEEEKCGEKNSTDLCNKLGCKGKCQMLPTGPECICDKGFKYEKSTGNCVDINECEEFGICSQICKNSIGSYSCECANGYKLNSDKKSCDSSSVDDVFLVFTTKKYIKRIQLSTGFETLVSQTRRPIGITYDGDNYYWTEVSSGKEAIVKMKENSTQKEILFTSGLELPEDIAVDWLTKNIYFTDSSRNHIAVCTSDGYYCTELIQSPEMEKVRAIALHPLESLIFWSDWGKDAHIGVSFMDGSQAKVLVRDVLWPNGLTLDWPNGRIYWIDALDNKIESTTIEGKDRRIILKDVFKHPFSIAVHGNRLYWSDKGSSVIEYCDKFTGKHHDVLSRNSDVFDVHIFDKNSMPPKRHACLNHRCSHICLLSKNDGFTCACPINMVLKENGQDCVISSQAYNLIFGIENYIISTPHNVFGRHAQQEAISIGKYTAHKIAYNSARGSVFVADNSLRIIIEYDLVNKMSTELVSKDIGFVTSMSYDYHANNLYWCDKIKNTIEVFSLNTKKRAIIQSYPSDHKAVAIVLAPSIGEMFVALQSKDHSHIDRQSMKGDLIDDSHHHVIESQLSLSGNIHFAIDEQLGKVYWSDSTRGVIEYSNFDGSERAFFAVFLSRSPSTLALIGDDIIWTSEKSRSLQSRVKNVNGPLKKFQIEMPESASSKSALSIVSGSPLIDSANPCKRDNGGCSDICISDGPRSRVCKCATGYTFRDRTNTTCIPQTICDFRCGSGECIKASDRCNGKADCADGSDEKCDTVTCRIDQFKCDDGSCIEGHLRCDKNHNCKDHSDEKDCKFQCQENQIQCKGVEKCVNIAQICDGKKDCPDGFDEKDEQCRKPCPKDNFKCTTGQCIPKSFECDKRIDCADGSDEHDQCLSKCKPPLKPCKDIHFCVEEKYFCDGFFDCPDKSDEANCEGVKPCDIDEFQCSSNPAICLDMKKNCDGIMDCPKGEDEVNCNECGSLMFECKNGQCIMDSMRCDGKNDCKDFSDEANCEKKNITRVDFCPPNLFKCNDGKCLDYSKVCDKREDCDSDEGPACMTACEGTKCNQICRKTPKGAVCACNPGYELKGADFECKDIDECLQNPCSQICVNTPGSYQCECHQGYMLSVDRVTCKALGGVGKLFYVLNDEIRSISVQSSETILSANFSLLDFAVDVKKEKLYFSAVDTDGLGILNMETREMKVLENITEPRKIFYDWITENIYILSQSDHRSVIQVCNAERRSYVLIQSFSHLDTIMQTGDIDPINRWLFIVKHTAWFSSKTSCEIIKIRLDGNEAVSVIEDVDIQALTVDIQTQKIYYTSGLTQSITSINYDGSNKKTFAHQSKFLRKPVDISLFEDHAYVIDPINSQVVMCKLYDDNECHPVRYLNTVTSRRATVVHAVKQKKIDNLCDGHRCEDICVIADTGRKCICGSEKELARACDEKIIVSAATPESEESSYAWLWTSMIIICVAALLVAGVYFVYQKRIFNNSFNVSVSFRNENITSEFPPNFMKSPSPVSPFTRRLPKMLGLLPKGFEVVNNDHNENHFAKSDEMQNYSDEEFMADAQFTSHDVKERLIN